MRHRFAFINSILLRALKVFYDSYWSSHPTAISIILLGLFYSEQNNVLLNLFTS